MPTVLFDRRKTLNSRTQLANAMSEWLEMFHNRRSRPSTLGYPTPVGYGSTSPAAPRSRPDNQTSAVRLTAERSKSDIVASVASRGDLYDNALVGPSNGVYMLELVYLHGPWPSLTDVGFATPEYIDW